MRLLNYVLKLYVVLNYVCKNVWQNGQQNLLLPLLLITDPLT